MIQLVSESDTPHAVSATELATRCSDHILKVVNIIGHPRYVAAGPEYQSLEKLVEVAILIKDVESPSLLKALAGAYLVLRSSFRDTSVETRNKILHLLTSIRSGDDLKNFWNKVWGFNAPESNSFALSGLLGMPDVKGVVLALLPEILSRAARGSLRGSLDNVVTELRQKLTDPEIVEASRCLAFDQATDFRSVLALQGFDARLLKSIGTSPEILKAVRALGWEREIAVSSNSGQYAFLSKDKRTIGIVSVDEEGVVTTLARSPALPHKIESADVHFREQGSTGTCGILSALAFHRDGHLLELLAVSPENESELRRVAQIKDCPFLAPRFLVAKTTFGSILGITGAARPGAGTDCTSVRFLLESVAEADIFDHTLYKLLKLDPPRERGPAAIDAKEAHKPRVASPRRERKKVAVVSEVEKPTSVVPPPAPARVVLPTSTDLFCCTDGKFLEREIPKLAATFTKGTVPEGGWLSLLIPLAFACTRLSAGLVTLRTMQADRDNGKFADFALQLCGKINTAIHKNVDLEGSNRSFADLHDSAKVLTGDIDTVRNLYSTLTGNLQQNQSAPILNWASYGLNEFGTNLGSRKPVQKLRQTVLGFFILNTAIAYPDFENRLVSIRDGVEIRPKPSKSAASFVIDLLKELRELK